MSQISAQALVAANMTALKAFSAAVTLGFQYSGPTLASKLAVQQMNTIIAEIDELATLATTQPLPLPADSNGYDGSILDTVFGTEFDSRFKGLEKYCKELEERIYDARQAFQEREMPPIHGQPLDPQIVASGSRMVSIEGIKEQAAAFNTFVQGMPGAIVATILERLAENIRNAPPPAPPRTTAMDPAVMDAGAFDEDDPVALTETSEYTAGDTSEHTCKHADGKHTCQHAGT
jgi:hypothetical protein